MNPEREEEEGTQSKKTIPNADLGSHKNKRTRIHRKLSAWLTMKKPDRQARITRNGGDETADAVKVNAMSYVFLSYPATRGVFWRIILG